MINLRALLIHGRRRGLGLALLATICATLLLAHSGAGMGHGAGVQTDGGHSMDAALSMCLAITEIVGGAVLLRGLVSLLARRRPSRWLDRVPVLQQPPLLTPLASARAGPALLQVFRR